MAAPVAGTEAPLQWTLQDQNGNPLDLTGATVTLVVVSPSTVRTTYPAAITSATAGTVAVTLNAAAIPTPGAYQLQWDVTFSDGSTGSTDPIANLIVSKAL